MPLDEKTLEQRKALAASMWSPIRCGGADYDEEGNCYLIIGGVRRSPAEVQEIYRRLNPGFFKDSGINTGT